MSLLCENVQDLGEFGIAPRAVTARETFNKQQEELPERAGLKRQADIHAVIPGEPPLQNLIIPAKSTVGARLLKSMGWKEGQGVGPKTVKYAANKDKSKIFLILLAFIRCWKKVRLEN